MKRKKNIPSADRVVSNIGAMYESIDDLPMARFIDCSCDGKLKALIKEGTVPSEQLQERWKQILDEFGAAGNDAEANSMFDELKELQLLKFKIDQAGKIVTALQISYNSILIRHLREMGIVGEEFDINDREAYHGDLDSVVGKIKRMELEYNARQSEHDDLEASCIVQVDRAYYTRIVLLLSKNLKYHLDINTITVRYYLVALRDYKDTLEALRAQNINPEWEK